MRAMDSYMFKCAGGAPCAGGCAPGAAPAVHLCAAEAGQGPRQLPHHPAVPTGPGQPFMSHLGSQAILQLYFFLLYNAWAHSWVRYSPSQHVAWRMLACAQGADPNLPNSLGYTPLMLAPVALAVNMSMDLGKEDLDGFTQERCVTSYRLGLWVDLSQASCVSSHAHLIPCAGWTASWTAHAYCWRMALTRMECCSRRSKPRAPKQMAAQGAW